jgi:hypothetical protein
MEFRGERLILLKLCVVSFQLFIIISDKSSINRLSPRCRICETGSDETVSHVISTCQGLTVGRENILADISKLCSLTKNKINFEEFKESEDKLCQFILAPTSLNLPTRVSLQDSLVPEFYKLSRDLCHVLDNTRIRLLRELEEKQLK